ncbi:J domain-containing protein [Halobaculum sp. D14]|uniref:J domain-containing protein n=1 Tax=Halobaculum sp. D14 TaxID=3421642 RepID=UPI003EBC4964
MDRDALVFGLAAVFAGITVVLTVLAFARSLFLLLLAAPFAASAYFMWYHASGRLLADARRRQASQRRTAAGDGPRGSQSRFGREARQRVSGERTHADARGAGRGSGRGGRGGSSQGTAASTGLSEAAAYRELGLTPGASEEDVKSAYRDRVKETHPDSGGDEESFKRVTRAYETLQSE